MVTLAEEVRARDERAREAADRWSMDRELLAVIADRLGVIGTDRYTFEKPPDRIRRPWEPDPNAPVTPRQFTRMLMGGVA